MATSKKELVEKGYKSVLTPKGSFIFKLIFKNQLSQEEIQTSLQKEHTKQNTKKPMDTQVLANLTSNYLKAWEDLGYLEKERRKISNPKSKFHTSEDVYFSTFKPLFDYIEKEKCIDLTEEEKRFLQNKEPSIHHLQWSRKQILYEYPNENLFDAIIKFYVKHYCIPYVEILDKDKEEIWTMTKNHIEAELYRSELLKKGLLEKRKKPSILSSYMNKLKTKHLSISESQEWLKTFDNLFIYILNFKENPKLVTSINIKFKKALGILA